MLEDRDYMRQPEFGGQRWGPGFRLHWNWTLTLVATYVVVLLAQQIATGYFPAQRFIFNYLALSREGLGQGCVWQLLTYQFMHAGWLHLIVNSWVIIVFGTELEHLLGGRRYLALLFASGIIGGVFQVLAALAWPAHFGGEVVGASAAAFGLVAAFALIFPERELSMLIFFVFPVQVRAKTLLLVSLAVGLGGIILPLCGMPTGNIANAAHLGGMAMGWCYVKIILKTPGLLGVAREERSFRPQPVKRLAKPADELEEGDVDAVLDKISARGINSLTSRERGVLEAARKKMARR